MKRFTGEPHYLSDTHSRWLPDHKAYGGGTCGLGVSGLCSELCYESCDYGSF